MKLLHTSDWHVGKAIRGISRADEHRAVLAEIARVARDENVDVIVVAGDLFDTASPSPESEEIVYRALLDLAATEADVVVIAGNHDNARRLRAVAPILELGRVHLVAEPTRPDAGGVISLTARDGAEVLIATLPFVSKRGIVRAEHLIDGDAFVHAQEYSARLRMLIDVLAGSFRADTVNVLAAHAFVLGAQSGGGERAAHLVEEYAVTAQSFPATISYGALGHLHRPQKIPAGAPLHYCGSPLQLDFGEADQAKQVNVVTLEPGAPADVRPVPLTSGRPLRTLTGSLEQLRAAEVPDDAFLRVVVREAGRAGLAADVREMLGEGVVDVRVESTAAPRTRRSVDMRSRSPRELFDEYLALEGVADERIPALFDELLDDAHETGAGSGAGAGEAAP
ncbi:MAG: exonuclease SbcCD subunit D [Acidimicrobiales bacterium]